MVGEVLTPKSCPEPDDLHSLHGAAGEGAPGGVHPGGAPVPSPCPRGIPELTGTRFDRHTREKPAECSVGRPQGRSPTLGSLTAERPPETPLPRGSCKPAHVPARKEHSSPEENPSSIRTRRSVLSPPPSWGCPVPQTRKITRPSLTPLKRGPFQLRAVGDVVPGRQPDTWPLSLPALGPACCQQSMQCSSLVHLSGPTAAQGVDPTFHGSPQPPPLSSTSIGNALSQSPDSSRARIYRFDRSLITVGTGGCVCYVTVKDP